MSLRWELMRKQPDSMWFLLDKQEPLAMLSVQHSPRPVGATSSWQRVEIAPEVWLVAGATLELLPGVEETRLSHLQLPPLHEGPIAIHLPPLP